MIPAANEEIIAKTLPSKDSYVSCQLLYKKEGFTIIKAPTKLNRQDKKSKIVQGSFKINAANIPVLLI